MKKIVVLLFLVSAFVSCSNLYVPVVDESKQADRFEQARVLPTRGAENGDVEIVQYSSFACSYCKDVSENLNKLLAREVGVTLVYKPMAFQKDVEGKKAARAVLAAAAQGKFWEMHDLLYQNQARLSEELYPELAAQLGLDTEQFAKDYDSDEIRQIVEDNTREAVNVGVEGTPTLFFNGNPVLGGESLATLQASIRNARHSLAKMK